MSLTTVSSKLQHEALGAAVDPAAAIEIFWPKAGAYSSLNVAGKHYPNKRWVRVTLEVPAQEAGAVLRLDPASCAGHLEIACIHVFAKGKRRGGFQFSSHDEIAALQMDELVPTTGKKQASLISLGIDPKLLLPPLPEALSGRRLKVQVVLRLNPSKEATLTALKPLIKDLERLSWLDKHWESQNQRCAELEHLEPAFKAAKQELDEHRNTSNFLRSELALARKELDWARNEIERLRKESERRKIAVRNAECTFHLRWTLPSFLVNRRQARVAQETGFEFQVETPKSWNLTVDAVTLQGWCFSKSETGIQAIRAKIDDRIFEGQYGRRRFDVQSIFPNYINSGRCGFEIEVSDLPQRFELLVEVLDDHDRWHTLIVIPGRLLRSIFGSDESVRSAEEGMAFRKLLMSLSAKEERQFKREIAKMTDRPQISIIMPVYNTPADYLREAIQSVTDQIYTDWQLCIADDASTSEATRKVLQEAAARDSRIVVAWRTENGGIATASNSALSLAKGSLIALMDHDDLLTPVALLRLAQASLAHAADFIYSDEGIINAGGDFTGGSYRPAFSLAYLRCHPYIVHIVALSSRLIREIGGFTDGLTISQDYDLILRAAEKAASIVHIPEMLYLWRQVSSSAGHTHQESVMELSTSILEGHLDRSNLPGSVEPGFGFNFFKTRSNLDLAQHSVAIIIPTKNQASLLRQCIRSIEKTLPPALNAKIVIVDHDSDDNETLSLLAELRTRHTVLPYSGTFNYSAINNYGVRRGAGDAEFLLFCNNDIEAVEAGWMETLLNAMIDPTVGAVGPLLLYPDNETVQHAGVGIGLTGLAEHLGKFMPIRAADGSFRPGYHGVLRVTREISAITTGLALFRRRAFEAVGGFSEELQVGFNDTDLCLRLWQAGYRVLYTGETYLLHHESATRGKSFDCDPHPADSRRFRERWGWLMERGDPFYNPNLRLDSTSWESSPVTKREPKPNLRRYSNPASLFQK